VQNSGRVADGHYLTAARGAWAWIESFAAPSVHGIA